MELSLAKMLSRKLTDISFTELTPAFLWKWEFQMKQAGNKPGTISVYLRTLRALLSYARLEKLTRMNPFAGEDKFSMAKYNQMTTQKRALSKEAIEAIQLFPTAENSSEFHVKNFFMFSFYTRGMNITDIALLRPENRQGNYLECQRQKTHRWQKVYLLEPARAIWEYYLQSMNSDQQIVFWFILGQKNAAEQVRTRLEQR